MQNLTSSCETVQSLSAPAKLRSFQKASVLNVNQKLLNKVFEAITENVITTEIYIETQKLLLQTQLHQCAILFEKNDQNSTQN